MRKFSKGFLRSLGLTETQAAVYLAALELGEAYMQELARKSGVKRTSIYNFIDELRERGLLTETVKKKRKVYSAIDPRQLLEIEKGRLAELERTMPELLAVQNRSKTKPSVRFYEGIDGLKQVYSDMLKEGQEILAFEDLEHMKAGVPKPFFDWFPPERARRGIPMNTITRDSVVAQQFTQNNAKLLRRTKLMKSADWRTDMEIYGNKVALISYRTKTPFCVLIEDPNIAETLRAVWKELWSNLKLPTLG